MLSAALVLVFAFTASGRAQEPSEDGSQQKPEASSPRRWTEMTVKWCAPILVLLIALSAASQSVFNPAAPADQASTSAGLPHAPLHEEVRLGGPPQNQPQGTVTPASPLRRPRVIRVRAEEEGTREFEIHPSLPPFAFRWVPNPPADTSNEPKHVGRIEISRKGSAGRPQVIELWSFVHVSRIFESLHAQDVNFDGYQDIGVLSGHGAKWGSYAYWLFDPTSGRFITNRLTRELSRLGAHERHLDPKSRTIKLEYLTLGEAPVSDTYRIGKNRLTLVEAQREAGRSERRPRDRDDEGREREEEGHARRERAGARVIVPSADETRVRALTRIGENARRTDANS